MQDPPIPSSVSPKDAEGQASGFDLEILLAPDDAVPDDRTFRIGELAREFGLTLRALRFYEDRGLLNPKRRGATRLYSGGDRTRLRFILLTKAFGFSLLETQQMVALRESPGDEKRKLETLLELFLGQKEALLAGKRDLEMSLDAMDTSIAFLRSTLD